MAIISIPSQLLSGTTIFGPFVISSGNLLRVTMSRVGWVGLSPSGECITLVVDRSPDGLQWDKLVGIGVMDDGIISPGTGLPSLESSVSNVPVITPCQLRVTVIALKPLASAFTLEVT
jgi:hypothetical protein